MATQVEIQEEAAAWVWDQVQAAAPAHVSELLHVPDHSEFDVIAGNGVRVLVRIEVSQ